MNCAQCIDRMSEYLDDELDARVHQVVQVHLNLCSECQTLLKEIKAAQAHFQEAISLIPIAPGLEDRILAGLQIERTSARRQLVLTGVALLLLASPILLILASLFFSLLHWLLITKTALWQLTLALVQGISPVTTIGICLGTLSLIGIGAVIIRILLRGIHLNEVFS